MSSEPARTPASGTPMTPTTQGGFTPTRSASGTTGQPNPTPTSSHSTPTSPPRPQGQPNVGLAVGLTIAAVVIITVIIIVAGYFIWAKYRKQHSTYESLPSEHS